MVHSAHLCWDLARISATGWDSQTHNPPVPAYVSSNDTGRRGGENRVRKSRFLGLPGGPCLSHSSDPIAWVKGLPFKDYVYSLQQLLVVPERERFINPFLSVKISLSRNRILDGEIGFTSCERKIERTIEGSDLIIIRNGIYIYTRRVDSRCRINWMDETAPLDIAVGERGGDINKRNGSVRFRPVRRFHCAFERAGEGEAILPDK